MQDYYHYEYICPYLTQVIKHRVTCERGCCVIFSKAEEARRFLRTYCCGDYGACSIAKMLNDYWEGEEE